MKDTKFLFRDKMILKYQIILLLMNKLLVNGEWIEMPQFSDDSKVYKLSTHSHFNNKFSINDYQKTVSEYDNEKVSQLLNEFGNGKKNISQERPSSYTEDSTQYLENTAASPSVVSEEFMDTWNNAEDEDLTVISPNNTELPINPLIPSTLEAPIDQPSTFSTSIPISPELESVEVSPKQENYVNETIKENLESFQDYLPIEMLKKVHQTLKSQPSTLKGKILFLKQFEKELMQEIEARLSSAITPIRRTRGAHDYWDHDEEMGFPSLEGALMAISFLTFAVYLVRLVMLLFRNANTNATATATTILFRRKRRTSDDLNDGMEAILNYLNTFDGN